MTAEQEVAVRNALVASLAQLQASASSVQAALALMAGGASSQVPVGMTGPSTAPAAAAPAASTVLGNKPIAVDCPHPEKSRQAMNGFGGKPAGKFFCRACERVIEER